jgi:hypothetical protein
MPDIIADPPVPPVISLFFECEPSNISGLVLISLRRARAHAGRWLDRGGWRLRNLLFNSKASSTCFLPVLSGGGLSSDQPEIGMAAAMTEAPAVPLAADAERRGTGYSRGRRRPGRLRSGRRGRGGKPCI